MRSKADFSLYLVADEMHLENFDSVIQKAIEGGVSALQFRAKNLSTRQMVEGGKKLLHLLRPFHIPLLINDRVDVALAIGADGVHLGQSDLDVTDARIILGKNGLIGLSVETLDQVVEANQREIDYLAASPIFPTKSKLNCGRPWGLEGLKQISTLSMHPIIAIGGITLSNVKSIMANGGAGVAIISGIFDSIDPKKAAEEFSHAIRK